jgi:hypothetical protein
VGHLRAKGFAVKPQNVGDLVALKNRHGIPRQLWACHTALVEGYVVEGHVPADTITRLLQERPPVAGVAVPGMPIGSPGMESPSQAPEPYEVLTFDKAGKTTVFETR